MNRNEVLEKLKSAIQACNYAVFGKRAESFLRDKTGLLITVYPSKEEFRSSHINIWQGEEYPRERVEVSFYLPAKGAGVSWQDKVLSSIERMFTYAYDERQEQEKSLHPALDSIEGRIYLLQCEAAKLVSSLPIPSSAKEGFRDSFMWESASVTLRKKYPLSFEWKVTSNE